jgi:hypothetical protein
LSTLITGLKQVITLDGSPEPQTPQELIERLVQGGRTVKTFYDSIMAEQRARQQQEVSQVYN